MNSVSERGDRGRPLALVSAALAFVLLAVLVLSARAQASELIYWDNYRAEPAIISVANIDGSGGGPLNLAGAAPEGPEGMAFDSATGRLYIAASSAGSDKKGQIVYVNVDGTGAGVLPTPGVEVNNPLGVAIDPATRTIYWTNGDGGIEDKGTIAFARLDGSGGGFLNTAPVVVNEPYRIAIDPVTGKVFWDNSGNTPEELAYANMNNTGGGGTLPLPAVEETMYGIAVDSAAGRVYWLDSSQGKERLLFANINGSPGGAINLAGALNEAGYGLAIDTSIGRIYWANYGNGASTPKAIGFVNLAGGGGSITPTTAPVDGAQDPVILKSPSGTALPTVTRSKKTPAALSCSSGEWAADLPGAFVYQAPRTLAYQWSRNGTAISGATAATLTAKSAAKYSCTVTAANQAGVSAQTSAPVNVKAAKVKLTTKKKAKAKPGQTVKFKLKAANQGDLKAKNARVCVKLPKAAKGALKSPKCKRLGGLKGRGKKSTILRIKVLDSASGTYKVTFQVKGAKGKAAKAKIVVG